MSWRSKETREYTLIALNASDELIVFDCETTGFSATKNHIIQLAAKKYRIINETKFEEIDELNQYINPGYSLPPKIVELTGITDEFLFDKPNEDEAFEKIHDFFKNAQCIAGWNSNKFDIKFVKTLFERQGVEFVYDFSLDGLEMARDLVPNNEKENNKLGTIAAIYGADHGLTFHNAFDDVIATARLISVFVKEYEEISKNEVENTESEIEKKIPVVTSVNYWAGFRGFSRQYVNTNLGSFYFDIRSKSWNKKKDNPYDLNEIDMESLKRDAWEFVGATNEDEFSRYRGEDEDDDVAI